MVEGMLDKQVAGSVCGGAVVIAIAFATVTWSPTPSFTIPVLIVCGLVFGAGAVVYFSSAAYSGGVSAARNSFPLWEAACLMAKVPAQRNPTGEASSYLHQLKVHIAKQRFGRNIRRFQYPIELLASQVDQTSDSHEITRSTFKAFALSRGITIRGLTDA